MLLELGEAATQADDCHMCRCVLSWVLAGRAICVLVRAASHTAHCMEVLWIIVLRERAKGRPGV